MLTDLQRPWEPLGASVPVEGRLQTGEALRLTNMDWKVDKVSIISAPNIVYLLDDDGEKLLDAEGSPIKDVDASENADLFGIANPQMCVTVRVDTRSYLGTVGKRYKIVQNTEFATFFDEALGKEAAAITAVGNLGRFGARVFMMATLPEMLEIIPGDPIERHILLTTTHDGSGPVEAVFVAWDATHNTMIHAPGGRVAIRHTKNADRRLAMAHKVLHDNQSYWDRIKRAFAYMAKRDANEARVREFLEAMFPDIVETNEEGKVIERRTSRQALAAREQLQSIFDRDEYGLPKSDWGLYNSIAIFVDHERNVAKNQKKDGISRWEISVFGRGADLRDKAYRWLTRNR
jgi:phage/plasmid-like protein (TIGR03299 family)